MAHREYLKTSDKSIIELNSSGDSELPDEARDIIADAIQKKDDLENFVPEEKVEQLNLKL